MPSVELFGQAQILAGEKAVRLQAGTIREALALLASQYPRLVGPVLEADGSLTPAYVLNLNGTRFTREVDEPLGEGDALLVISSLSGG
jgi:molybdopterin converting factor small subunit